ncbi:MAG: hypothetical protein GKS05_10560 [Nitrospirales bacterium]|nr:hypothetical protein [Nitrospirales bacterium]
METWDWVIVVTYCLLITFLGLAFKKRAEGGIEAFFLSGRKLPWWLAGTSLVATSFASDTPLFVTSLVRTKGVAGNWDWWFMALASVASLFFFARLWRRAGIVTDMEFIELRYGSGAGAFLRGAKAIFLGVVFNIYALGAWPVLGLTKVLEESTTWSKGLAVLFCALLALLYSVFSGFWGVVATDFVQFFLSLLGATVLAVVAISATGGLGSFWEATQGFSETQFLPAHTPDAFWSSPWIFFLSLVLVQWWARGVEGDGMAVQRLSACKDEKHSFFAMLWFNIAHYAIRPWPWIMVALASMVLLPEVTNGLGVVDHERAYPRMIIEFLPVGLRGLVIASFFAAFMSTVDSHLNWGSSYVVNDVYRRFFKPDADARHYVLVGRLVTVVLMMGGGLIAFFSSSIVEAFYNVLLLFSGVGLVGVARWFWWRVNAWSEITAMLASGILTLFVSHFCHMLNWPNTRPVHLGIVVIGSTVTWLAVTFLTQPTSEATLKAFYEKVRPTGPGWKPIAPLCPQVTSSDSLMLNAIGWLAGVVLILGATMAIGKALLGFPFQASVFAITAVVGLFGVWFIFRKMKWNV